MLSRFNGLWILGRIGDKEISVIYVFVGLLTLVIALYLAFGRGPTPVRSRPAR